jgi:predicted metal-dependent phosphoesterase TrpH
VSAVRIRPLLCELHAHTTWSDGAMTPRELIDLYGRAGFDVLAVTDHVVREEGAHVHAGNHARYLAAIEREAVRARDRYGLLVVPGLELTYDDPEPALAAHAVAVGVREFVGLQDGLDAALRRARSLGAALIAAHPYALDVAAGTSRGTGRFAADPLLRGAVDRFELFNRHELFSWVGEARLPSIATGDVHLAEHLATWKTLLPCAKDERAVLDYLRSPRPAYVVDLTGAAAA